MNAVRFIPLLMLALAGCAQQATIDSHASTNAKATNKATAAAKADDNKPHLICQFTKPLGSNITKRVCRTPEEIKAAEEQSQEAMRHMERSSNQTHQ